MTHYPAVLSEHETIQQVLQGRSLARYGDGEFKMCRGAGIKSQGPDPILSRRLRSILHNSGQCMVGIPNIHSETPKSEFWRKHMQFSGLLGDRPYVSSFVTRPDSAPWIDTPDYWSAVATLWRGQDVTVVRGSGKSLSPDDLDGAGDVTDVLCPRQHAFAEYDSILARIGTPKRAVICLGPTATVLAVDLCARGVHAIDLGHIAIFMRKRRRGEPMVVTDEDRAVDRVMA